MEENKNTYVSGVRTSPIQYEKHHKKYVQESTTHKKYSVSPIYDKQDNIDKLELKEEGPVLIRQKKTE